MENLILGAFCLVLFLFIFTGLPLLGALFVGFLLFSVMDCTGGTLSGPC